MAGEMTLTRVLLGLGLHLLDAPGAVPTVSSAC
jgi:hypothetical protein